jgi:hypothetical protein
MVVEGVFDDPEAVCDPPGVIFRKRTFIEDPSRCCQ